MKGDQGEGGEEEGSKHNGGEGGGVKPQLWEPLSFGGLTEPMTDMLVDGCLPYLNEGTYHQTSHTNYSPAELLEQVRLPPLTTPTYSSVPSLPTRFAAPPFIAR